MGSLASTDRRDPERARFASPSTGLDCTAQNHDVFVRRVSMGRNDGAAGEAGTMD